MYRKSLVFVVLILLVFAVALISFAAVFAEGGFDDAGYNRTARIFNGTGLSWCMDKFGNEAYCESYLGPYAGDKLVMKWNDEWDRGNAEGWDNPPYDAWLTNQWNGSVEGGSGEMWFYKYRWIGTCGAYGDPTDNGGYCIWGQFEVVMSHGTFMDEHPMHYWDSHSVPSGMMLP